MKLSEAQQIFAYHVGCLITHATAAGYTVTFGHAYRCPDCPVGKQNSNHKKRLAVDLNLFRDGVYLDDTEDHRELGEYWEALDSANRWGGNFSNKDGNHYERIHE